MTNAVETSRIFGLSAKLVCDTSLSPELYGELFLPICIESARIRHHDDTGSIGIKIVVLDAQAIFRRRRHQPRRPPLAKITPGLGQRLPYLKQSVLTVEGSTLVSSSSIIGQRGSGDELTTAARQEEKTTASRN